MRGRTGVSRVAIGDLTGGQEQFYTPDFHPELPKKVDKHQFLLFDNYYRMISTADFASLCRKHQLAATHQRRVIYETVMSLEGHPSPELIYEAVRKKIPSISLATVYKNVRTFLESGMLREVSMHHGSLRVEPNEAEHYHLVCTHCRRITDLDSETVSVRPLKRKRSLKGFQVTRISVDVLGVCAACAAKENSHSNKMKRREKAC
jgi:Fur family transcriptional regulator, peroxide stress response regulator